MKMSRKQMKNEVKIICHEKAAENAKSDGRCNPSCPFYRPILKDGFQEWECFRPSKEMINYISANYQYVSAINKSYASDKLYSFFFSYFYLKVGNLLKNHKFFGQEIIRYISVLSAQELNFWISNKRAEKNASLIKRLNTIWRYLVTQYQSDIKRVV